MTKNNALHRANLIKRIMKPIKNKQKTEPESKNSNDSSSRFDGSTSGTKIYKRDTPGQ